MADETTAQAAAHAAPIPAGAATPGARATTPVPRTARDRARAHVMAELLAAARTRLAEEGPGQLSLRAVARDLGMASSAVYRYVPSRDALLTVLVIESYDAVGRAAEDALDAACADGHGVARAWLDVARAVRAWARADRHAYELVYGTPVPRYEAPTDTIRAAQRLWAVLAAIVQRARAEGALDPAGPALSPDVLERMLEPYVFEFAGLGADAPTTAPEHAADVARTLTLFTALTGAISAELFGHFHRVTLDADLAFDVLMATSAAGLGLRVPPEELDRA